MEIYRELRVTFPSVFVSRDDTENVTHQEYLITRGLRANMRQYTMHKTTIITVRLEEPLAPHAKAYLDYLKVQSIIEDWSVTETQMEEEET
jgi:hypothetical protein